MLHETVVRGPALRNGYATHQMAYDLLRTMGDYAHDDARVLFDVRPLPQSEEAIWYFRGPRPLEHGHAVVPPVQGQAYALSAHISLGRKSGMPVTPKWVEAHFATGMERSGIHVESHLEVIFHPSVKVKKKGLSPFSLRNIEVFAPAVRVIDAEKAVSLLATGYGRGKSFGFGVIHLQGVKA